MSAILAMYVLYMYESVNLASVYSLPHLQIPPEMAGFVTNLCFAETHVSGGGPQACMFASTMGSVLIRYSLSLPEPAERLAQINRAFLAGMLPGVYVHAV